MWGNWQSQNNNCHDFSGIKKEELQLEQGVYFVLLNEYTYCTDVLKHTV